MTGPEGEGRRSLDPRGRIPFYTAFLGCTVLLGVSVAAFAYLETLGNLSAFRGVLQLRLPELGPRDPLGGFHPTGTGQGRRVLLFETAANVDCARRQRFDLGRERAAWSRLARRAGFGVSLVGQAPGADASAGLWVVPWSLCLAPGDLAALDAHLRGGGGVAIGGPVDHGRALARDGPLRTWLGARAVRELGGDAPPFLVAAHRTPPAAALAPGQRVVLASGPEAWAVDAPHPALYWSRFELRPLPAPRGGRWAAAAAAQVGSGRLVWFGVPLTRAQGEAGSALAVAALLALQWAAGDTVVALAPWPDARRYAFVAAVDALGEAASVRPVARALARRRVPATFFWFSGALEGGQALRPLVGEAAEIASRGDRPVPLAGHARTEQERRLLESRHALERAGGRSPVGGLHPPDEASDELTLHASARAGYGYVLGDPDYDRAYPRVLLLERRLAILPRAGAGDDWVHVGALGGRDPRSVASRFLVDLERLRDLSGLYVLSLRPDLLGDRSLRPALERILARATTSDAWVATAGAVADWASRRSRVRLLVEEGGGGTELRNEGEAVLAELALEVYAGSPEPRALRLAPLAPGERRALALGSRVAVATP